MITEVSANPAGATVGQVSTLRDGHWTHLTGRHPPNRRANCTNRCTCVLMVGSWSRWVSSIRRLDWHETLTVDGSTPSLERYRQRRVRTNLTARTRVHGTARKRTRALLRHRGDGIRPTAVQPARTRRR